MQLVNGCPACHTPVRKSHAGITAPFLAGRIWDRAPFSVKLMQCRDCGFQYFNPRLDDEEEKRLYEGYRLEHYQTQRQSYEPWYTKKFNEGLSAPEGMTARKDALRRVLVPHLDGHPIRTVLDFGGNRGELIEDLIPSAQRYVFDISDLETLPGIGHLKTVEECQRHQWDLVVCSNVLEHVRDPALTMGEIAKAAHGAPTFIEVPKESPSGPKNVAKRLVQLLLLLVSRPAVGRALLRPALIYMMHEHVNFFSQKSLQTLTDAMGWQVLAGGEYDISAYKFGIYRVTSGRMIWCLARTP